MLICPVCQKSYPAQAVSCPDDGALLSVEVSDDALSTLEEGLSAEQLLGAPELGAPTSPPRLPSGKLSLQNMRAVSAPAASAETPEPHVRVKTGPVVVVKVSAEDSLDLIKAETLMANERPAALASLSLSGAPGEEVERLDHEDGGVSTLEEPLSPFDPYLGAVVTNYKIEKKLGQGGMGAVYLATHFTLGRQVAIKILNQQFVSKHDVVRRFFDEARAANKISHPNIIEVFDVGVLPDRAAYLIMELLEGSDLKSVLKQRGALPSEEVQALFVPICEALQAAHDNGIIHRDLKPENIFICRAGGRDFPKIVDFGIAKLSDNNLDVQLRTRTGMVMGTPAYMSPEQAAGQTALDTRADIYSLGVILFECLTGSPPFKGESVAALLIKQVTEIPEEMRALAPEKHIPPRLNALVQRCLEKNPADRPQSMRELLEQLRAPETFASSGTVEAVARPPAEAPALPSEAKPETPRRPPTSRRSWLWGAVGVLGVVVVLGGWALSQKRAEAPRAAPRALKLPSLEFLPPSPAGLMRGGQELHPTRRQ